MQKYQLGQDVKVEFMGVITAVELRGEVPFYTVKGNTANCIFLTDKEIMPLEEPKEK